MKYEQRNINNEIYESFKIFMAGSLPDLGVMLAQ